MRCQKIFNSKVLLCFFNSLYLVCGVTVLVLGFLLMCDSNRILLSRLLTTSSNEALQPPFYYGALALMAVGFFMVGSGVIGCWAACTDGYCVLTMYFFSVLTITIAQGAACVVVVAWPGCVGLQSSRDGAVKTLQATYGVPGKEQFTAAMDLAQTNFECCGMTDSRNYDMSLWQLQRFGPRDLIVPLTCCVQDPHEASFLDPKPSNETICQELLLEHFRFFRHDRGCLAKVEVWYQRQYIGFLIVVFVLSMIEFGALFGTVYSCTNVKKSRKASSSREISEQINNAVYHNKISSVEKNSADAYLYPDSFYGPRTNANDTA